MTADMQAARLIVDMCDPQALDGGVAIGQAARKEFPRRGEAVELERGFRTLIAHVSEISRSSEVGPLQLSPERRKIAPKWS
jgi:hypothetical protein